MSRRRSAKYTSLVVALLTLFITVGQRYGWFKGAVKQAQISQPGLYNVTEFVDGDTIKVDMNGGIETVRLIGVDTPETHDPRKAVQCYGAAAADFTRQFIGSQPVRLAADPINTNRDRYNRLLRYVYLADGRLVNAEIIKQGYGFAYTAFPFEKSDQFRSYEKQARQHNLGLWNSCQIFINQYGGEQSSDIAP